MSLTLENIGRRINKNWIIKGLNLHVAKGECLALLGPSGCGKSSTLRLIAGLDKPDEGTIKINHKDVTNISPVNRRIGMVFQSYALYPHLNVADNLSLGLRIRGVPVSEQKKRVNNALGLMQIESLFKRFPSELSGGQRQRVALARAILRDPKVYLLDEPMSNLDAQLREELRPELRNLILKGGQPVVYVTHDQHEAMAMANRIAVLKNGRLEQIGTPENLYAKPSSIFVASFIGRPQMNIFPDKSGLIKAIRPEDLKFSNNGLKCNLVHKEWLGSSQLLLLDSQNGLLRLLCGSEESIPEEIYINWSSEKEHYFDSNTGKRIDKSRQ